eukprot:gb/GEZN01017377.1/.p1 GENE.gb/GEZN01017377.1/~~gb/GEZN01017377.1/.p1  ORF type:complete len:114 (+),score=17.62 gb/GEZN01017377.1/:109-450(+)
MPRPKPRFKGCGHKNKGKRWVKNEDNEFYSVKKLKAENAAAGIPEDHIILRTQVSEDGKQICTQSRKNKDIFYHHKVSCIRQPSTEKEERREIQIAAQQLDFAEFSFLSFRSP